jgi:DNA-binding NtrC family response regulator
MHMEKRQILVIDDDPVFASLLQQQLLAEAVSVDVASTVDAALLLLQHYQYGLTVVDLDMRDRVSGIDVLMWMRDRKLQTFAIVASGYLPEYVTQMLTLFDFVKMTFGKPLDVVAFASVAKSLLQSHDAQSLADPASA